MKKSVLPRDQVINGGLSEPLDHQGRILIPFSKAYYEGESIKKQPNLFLGEIDLFFFDVIDALGPTVFQCYQPRTEEARVLVSNPLLNCHHDFVVGPEMTSTDILFQVWE